MTTTHSHYGPCLHAAMGPAPFHQLTTTHSKVKHITGKKNPTDATVDNTNVEHWRVRVTIQTHIYGQLFLCMARPVQLFWSQGTHEIISKQKNTNKQTKNVSLSVTYWLPFWWRCCHGGLRWVQSPPSPSAPPAGPSRPSHASWTCRETNDDMRPFAIYTLAKAEML